MFGKFKLDILPQMLLLRESQRYYQLPTLSMTFCCERGGGGIFFVAGERGREKSENGAFFSTDDGEE